ncbi:MAG: ribbon-helix-helix protein, CopG family [Proteobacteria bacterium]|nr:ribbon-helix-helix protein, CopG family [Pseudomonadota bacterium]
MTQNAESPPSAAFTVRLDKRTLQALDGLAEKTERPRNWLVTQAVQDYVALNAWQVEKIEKGLAAANKGDFASAKDIQRLKEKFFLK